MLPPFATQTVIRQRPTAYLPSSHGNNIPDWSAPTDDLAITGCSIQPVPTDQSNLGRGASMDEPGRGATLAAYTVFMPPDADIASGDHLVIDGDTFAFFGVPEKWKTGVLDHVKVVVRQWKG